MSHCRQCQSHTERVTSDVTSDVTNFTFSSVWSESNNTCQSPERASQCVEEGGECVTLQEGFYIMSAAWLVVGAVWFVWLSRTVRHLQTINVTEWRVVIRQEKNNDEEEKKQEKFKYFYCF